MKCIEPTATPTVDEAISQLIVVAKRDNLAMQDCILNIQCAWKGMCILNLLLI